ncbi:DUF2062 domain-containing protein [Psychrobacter sp. JCM 18901]|uniref:DUF2062 domain-containing protein n=1 Tax=Psychrobacter sp. JCM 18901 TaxID=1298609 RepID=UPI0021C34684|nr:DUF2062 domain-containing protein [Psychrobacter sp. JCM 18901]
MPQKRLKDLLPTPEKILESRTLKLFAPHLADPRLWHFNRHSLNKAVYIGVLSAFFSAARTDVTGTYWLAYFSCQCPYGAWFDMDYQPSH